MLGILDICNYFLTMKNWITNILFTSNCIWTIFSALVLLDMKYNYLAKCILKYLYSSHMLSKYFHGHVQGTHLAILWLAFNSHPQISTTFFFINNVSTFLFPIPISLHSEVFFPVSASSQHLISWHLLLDILMSDMIEVQN